MSVALVITHKQMGAHKWSNTHAIQIGVETSQAPSNADLTAAGAASTLDATTTGSSPSNILQAIVAFERVLHSSSVQFTDVLVTDGKSNTGANASTVYASISMSGVTGSRAAPTTVDITPGNVTLLVHRNVIGFGHKPGRMFLRGVLGDGEVEVGGARMLQFSGNTLLNMNTLLTTAVGRLTGYLYSGTGATPATFLCLPLYVTPKQLLANPALPKVGTLNGVVPLSGYGIVGPVGRQVQRGRKKKKAAGTP